MQTQAVFRQLVNSSIVQNDNTIMLNNFRTAVKDTNVILNQNVSPGLLIIPSSLIILEHPIPGYNNYLTTSSADMRFGTNTGLNKIKEEGQNTPPLKHEVSKKTPPKKLPYHSVSPRHEVLRAKPSELRERDEYSGLGATGNDTQKSDNKVFWGIVAAISGLIVFEIVISNEGFSFRAQSKNK